MKQNLARIESKKTLLSKQVSLKAILFGPPTLTGHSVVASCAMKMNITSFESLKSHLFAIKTMKYVNVGMDRFGINIESVIIVRTHLKAQKRRKLFKIECAICN